MRDSDIDSYCYFAYVGPFWFIGLMSDKRRDRKLMFHLNQGLVLFITEVISVVLTFFAGRLLAHIPLVGAYLRAVMWLAVLGVIFWLSVRGMLTVAADTKRRLPLIGRITLLR